MCLHLTKVDGFVSITSGNCCVQDRSTLSFQLLGSRLCQSRSANVYRRLALVHTRVFLKIVVVMEVAGLGSLITAIAIPTDMV